MFTRYSALMRHLNLQKTLVITIAAAAILAAQNGRSPEVQLKAAQNKEQVEGDLKGAIELYKKLIQTKDRTVAAKALAALGQCYEKLGNAEARSTYERLLKEFRRSAGKCSPGAGEAVRVGCSRNEDT